MTIDTTYLDLYCANEEVNAFAKTYPTISKLILGDRIVKFPKENAVYLNLMYEKIRKLYEEHIELKEDGTDFAMQKTIIDVDGVPTNKVEPKFKDGHEQLFREGWNNLMKSHCQITI